MRSGPIRCLLWHYSSWILGTDGYWRCPVCQRVWRRW